MEQASLLSAEEMAALVEHLSAGIRQDLRHLAPEDPSVFAKAALIAARFGGIGDAGYALCLLALTEARALGDHGLLTEASQLMSACERRADHAQIAHQLTQAAAAHTC